MVKIKISHFCPLQRSLWLPLEIPYWPLTEKILSTLMYATTYPCESGFSTFLSIRMKSRNRLKSQADIRAAISNIVPRFEALRSRNKGVIELKYIGKCLDVNLLISIFCTYFKQVNIFVEYIQIFICVIFSCPCAWFSLLFTNFKFFLNV